MLAIERMRHIGRGSHLRGELFGMGRMLARLLVLLRQLLLVLLLALGIEIPVAHHRVGCVSSESVGGWRRGRQRERSKWPSREGGETACTDISPPPVNLFTPDATLVFTILIASSVHNIPFVRWVNHEQQQCTGRFEPCYIDHGYTLGQ